MIDVPAGWVDVRGTFAPMFRTTRYLLCCAVLAHGAMLRAQSDSTAWGGVDDAESYEEAGDGLLMDAESEAAVWDRSDSLFHIPGHELYESWNTDVIFDRSVPVTADARLVLAQSACDHHMPVCGRITSNFGPRRSRMHYGVDIKLNTGDTVVSAFEGMVRISRYHRQFGHVVVVRHPNGLETLYAHLSRRIAENGDRVEAGQPLGLGGNTGRSTGSHLHFEVRYLGRPIDPTLVFDVNEGTLHADTLVVGPALFKTVEEARKAVTRSAFHRVRSGDTLSAISRRYGVPVKRLCQLNRIRQASVLRVGQRIRYR